MNKKMMAFLAVINAVALTAGASIISDSFDDGAIGTNLNGDGTGFNTMDTGAAITYTESDVSGELHMYDTATGAKTIGVTSKDKFNVDVTTATWDTKGIGFFARSSYVSFILGSGGDAALNNLLGGVMVVVDPENLDAQGEAKFQLIGKDATGSQYLLRDWTNTNLDLSKNFSLSLAIDSSAASGVGNAHLIWTGKDSTGAATVRDVTYNLDDSSEGGSGTDFDTFFTEDVFVGVGYRTPSDTGGNSTKLKLASIEVIPEPATLGLFAAAGGGIMFIRRRMLI